MAKLAQGDAYEVETLARTYYQPGPFSEPFLRVTFLCLNSTSPGVPGDATLDINGIVPLPAGIPITFDCKTIGKNISNIQVDPGTTRGSYVIVYFTKYRGFVWNRES